MSNPDKSNPYASPSTADANSKLSGEMFAPCPHCQGKQATRIRWTIWGGIVGPKLFTHVKCVGCGSKYNGKTGNSNTIGIVIYICVSVAVILFLMLILPMLLFAP